jgi:F420-non-reducing hydrogenase iron-sulfur subunit
MRFLMKSHAIKIYLFFCSTSIDQIELEQGLSKFQDELKTIPLPCSGKLDILYLVKAFESGADGVVIVTCKQGECRYLEGNLRARKRAGVIDTLLEEIGLGKGRIAIIQMSDGGIKQVIHEIKDIIDIIKALPGNTDTLIPTSVVENPHVVTVRKENT